jgi:hypothetical protein
MKGSFASQNPVSILFSRRIMRVTPDAVSTVGSLIHGNSSCNSDNEQVVRFKGSSSAFHDIEGPVVLFPEKKIYFLPHVAFGQPRLEPSFWLMQTVSPSSFISGNRWDRDPLHIQNIVVRSISKQI